MLNSQKQLNDTDKNNDNKGANDGDKNNTHEPSKCNPRSAGLSFTYSALCSLACAATSYISAVGAVTAVGSDPIDILWRPCHYTAEIENHGYNTLCKGSEIISLLTFIPILPMAALTAGFGAGLFFIDGIRSVFCKKTPNTDVESQAPVASSSSITTIGTNGSNNNSNSSKASHYGTFFKLKAEANNNIPNTSKDNEVNSNATQKRF